MREQEHKSQDELKHIRRMSYIKMAAMVGIVAAVIAFSSIAWFTMNREVEGSGMQMKSDSDSFSIEPINNSHSGIFDDSSKPTSFVRSILLNAAGKNSSTVTWQITDDVATIDPDTQKTVITKGKNIGNGPGEGQKGGISPGSSGELQFIIRSFESAGSINAEFEFYMYAYTGGYDEFGDEDKSTIQIVSNSSSNDAKIAQTLLNGHILLYTSKDNNGKLSGLISSNDEFKRIMRESYSSDTTVSVYWVWPETLAELLLDDSIPAQHAHFRGRNSLCNETGRKETVAFFNEHPRWFMLDPKSPNETWSSVFYSTVTDNMTPEEKATAINTDFNRTINAVTTNYSVYSSYYNEADQCIGTYISYILLDMNADGAADSE